MIKREDIQIRYCEMGAKVGRYFGSQYAYDCFCRFGDNVTEGRFQYEARIYHFIEEAIAEKIEREGKPDSRWKDEE